MLQHLEMSSLCYMHLVDVVNEAHKYGWCFLLGHEAL